MIELPEVIKCTVCLATNLLPLASTKKESDYIISNLNFFNILTFLTEKCPCVNTQYFSFEIELLCFICDRLHINTNFTLICITLQ